MLVDDGLERFRAAGAAPTVFHRSGWELPEPKQEVLHGASKQAIAIAID
jgi:hypothetical protein